MKQMFGWEKLAARLDMAAEAISLLRGDANVEIPGIREDVYEDGPVTVHIITVLDQEGAQRIQRPPGKYITLQLPDIQQENEIGPIAQVIAAELARLLPPIDQGLLLVAGLGNRQATPDSLGPKVAELTCSTRHLFFEDELEGINRVCSVCTGVLGSSGIETAEILQAYCAQLHPTAVILVDSLAAVSLSRVGTTVQMTDTGICPGSGVGNSRKTIDRQVCGCPVIAIGIPTVVDASAIICQAITALGQHWQEQGWDIPKPDEDSCFFVQEQLLKIFQGQLTMTPKDIDRMMDIDGELLAAAIALAIHPSATAENYHDFIHY